jgi:hypothetical protein
MRTEQLAKFAWLAVGAIWFVTVAGCGGAYDSTAHGIVTLDGKAVPRGTVSFQPVSGGPAAYAMIGDDGSYSIRTGREQGLPSGDYQVSVTANEAPAAAHSANGGPPAPGKAITPAWYRMKETSGLKYTVARGKNEINLDLKSQPPASWNGQGKK